MVCYFLSNQDIHNLLVYNSDLRDATAARSIWAWALECFNSSSANSVKHFWNAATRRSLRVFNSSYNQNQTDHFRNGLVYSKKLGKLLNMLHFITFACSDIFSNCWTAFCCSVSAWGMSRFFARARSKFYRKCESRKNENKYILLVHNSSKPPYHITI